MIFTIFLSVPVTDDFRGLSAGKPLAESIKGAFDAYYSWAGNIPLNIMQNFFNPQNYRFYDGTGHSTGVCLVVFFLLFVLVLHKYLMDVLKYFFGSDEKMSVMAIVFVVVFLNSEVYSQIYYWYVGNAYLWAVALILVCQMVFFRFFDDYKISRCIVASIIGFLTCFSYQLAVFAGVIYLLFMIRNNSFKRCIAYIPLIFMFVGGCISAFSPGNFNRHNSIDSSINIGEALVFSIQNAVKYTIDAFLNPIVIFFVIFAIVFGYRHVKDKPHNIGMMVIGALLSEFGVLFPVSLGYSSSSVPNRMVFYVNFVIYIWIAMIFINLGACIKSKGYLNNGELKSLFIAGIAICWMLATQAIPNGRYRMQEFPLIKTYLNMENCIKESRMIRNIYSTIALSPDDEVTVYVKRSDYIITGIVFNPSITDNPDNWTNTVVANYYKKEKISVIITD